MLTLAHEMEALSVAVANHAARAEQEKQVKNTGRNAQRLEANRALVLDFMAGKGPLALNTICKAIGKKRATVYEHVQRLIDEGRVSRIAKDTRSHLFEYQNVTRVNGK